MRARPSERTKTPEEIAQDEKERLEQLEVFFLETKKALCLFVLFYILAFVIMLSNSSSSKLIESLSTTILEIGWWGQFSWVNCSLFLVSIKGPREFLFKTWQLCRFWPPQLF